MNTKEQILERIISPAIETAGLRRLAGINPEALAEVLVDLYKKIVTSQNVCPTPTHEHNYVPHVHRGAWSSSIPAPTMMCTKCGQMV